MLIMPYFLPISPVVRRVGRSRKKGGVTTMSWYLLDEMWSILIHITDPVLQSIALPVQGACWLFQATVSSVFGAWTLAFERLVQYELFAIYGAPRAEVRN